MCLLYRAPKALSLRCSSLDKGDQPFGLCLLCLEAAIFLACITVHSVISSTECVSIFPAYCFAKASLSLRSPPVSPARRHGGSFAGFLIGTGLSVISNMSDPISGKWSPTKEPSSVTCDLAFRKLDMM